MRIRTLAAATLVAAGLSVTLTGAASATPPDEPPLDGKVVVCEDGQATVRPLTEEERAEIKEMRARAVEVGPGEWRSVLTDEEGAKIKEMRVRAGAGPADGKPAVTEEGHVIFSPAPPGAEGIPGDFVFRGEGPGEGQGVTCAVPGPPPPVPAR